MDPERSARLLHYLLEQGADEFTITVMALEDTPAPFADAFEDALEPYARPGDIRPVLTASDDDFLREVRLWSLTRDSAERLLSFHKSGLMATAVGPDGWLEDLMVYRRGELVFGVLSHEQSTVYGLTKSEREQLAKLGI